MNNYKAFLDLLFKILSIGLIPTVYWINSINVESARYKDRVDRLERDLSDFQEKEENAVGKIDTEMRAVSKVVTQNQATLQLVIKDLGRIRNILEAR